MNEFAVVSVLLSVAAILAYLNHRYIKITPSIFMLGASLLISILLLIVANAGWHTAGMFRNWIMQLNFYDILVNGMLGFLLFAGALSIDIPSLKQQAWEISLLSIASTILSTFLMALSCYYLLRLFAISLNFADCLLFGALISPTDPIAVLAVFKKLNVAKKLQMAVASESLFNDGVAVVLFITIYQVVVAHHPATFVAISQLFLQQTVGGITAGIILGFLGKWLMADNNDLTLNILLTLALVSAGYNAAKMLHISGLLAMVVAGIIVGNSKFLQKESVKRDQFIHFWEIIDDVLNAILFLLIGVEIVNVHFSLMNGAIGLCSILLLLLVRYISVALPISVLKLWRQHLPYTITILTWGGLRGGLAIALALSLPSGNMRELFLVMTYTIVAFSILVQGATAGKLAKLVKK